MNAKKNLFLILFIGILFGACSSKMAKVEPVNPKENKEETKEMTTMVLISTSFGDMKAILYNETPLH
ncbi:MAG: hypothetical protein U0K90_01215, partial [Bacteroidales bacterium]|nr:hypothetical protein [Bacteroidales bacterium]